MLKEFEIGKMYRVKNKEELLNTEGVTVRNLGVEHKGFKEPFFFKSLMSELYNVEFVAENPKENTLKDWCVEPWMCLKIDGKEFELPSGLEYKFNSIVGLKYVDLIIDRAVKYERVKCNILEGKSLQLILNLNTENKCVVTFDIMQFVKGEIIIRDSESKIIICPYEVVPSEISIGDILTCKIQNYPLIGKVTEINGSPQGVLTVKVFEVPIESGMLGEEIYINIEDFERGHVKKLVMEWD